MPLKLTRRKNTGNWYLRGTVRGREIYESAGTDNKRSAEEIRIKREAELLHTSIHGESLTYTFTDAALSYLQWGGEGQHLQPLLDRFKGTPLAEIGQDAIDRAALDLKPTASPATWNRQIYTPMCAVMNHAASKNPPWCPPIKIKRPKVSNARVRWITKDEAERLIAAARPHLKPLVIFLLCTGVRISEALYLDWNEVDLVRRHVTIYGEPDEDDPNAIGTKNGEARGIPLHPRAVRALGSLRHRTGAVFRAPKKGPRAKDPSIEARTVGKPYKTRGGRGGGQIKTSWATLCKEAGIENFTPHDCRHTWATWHYMKNKDLKKLMELGGWKSIDMVMRYTHVDKAELAPSIDDMWAFDASHDDFDYTRAISVQSGTTKARKAS